MKNIIITGSSSGFGLITAKKLALEGHHVFATMRNIHGKNSGTAASLEDWANKNNVNITIVELDVTNSESVSKAVSLIAEKTGFAIDVLVNNAGSGYIGLNATLSAKQTDSIFQVNVVGVDRMIKAVLPYMFRKKDGLIITLSSVTSRQYMPAMGIYAASKAAVDALSVSYSYELKSSGIDVAIVQPGAYQTTDIVSSQLIPDDPSAEINYSWDMINYKNAMLKYFEPTANSHDPSEVADIIAGLISAPKNNRPLWTVVAAGQQTEKLQMINHNIQSLVDDILSARRS